jgi:hypothetical protein
LKGLPAWVLLALGCSGPGGGTPGATLELRILSHSTEPDVTTGAGTGSIAVKRAQASLSRLELVGCGDTGSIETSDLNVNLLGDPPFEVLFDTAVIDYCGVRVGLRSVDLTARGSDDVAIELVSALAADFELATSPPATPFDASRLVLGFDLGIWFDTVDVGGAAAGADGVVRLDAANNTALLASFEARTNLALGLFLDHDGDGQLDADELVPIATAN